MRASGLTLARPGDWRRRVKIKLRFSLPSLAERKANSKLARSLAFLADIGRDRYPEHRN